MIGTNIKAFRNIRGITQKELAELIGTAAGSLAHIEKGTRNPSLDVLYKIADALNVSILNLLTDEKEVKRFYRGPENINGVDTKNLMEWLDQILQNNASWENAKRVAIINLDEVERNNK